jgi:hypothetical protein
MENKFVQQRRKCTSPERMRDYSDITKESKGFGE